MKKRILCLFTLLCLCFCFTYTSKAMSLNDNTQTTETIENDKEEVEEEKLLDLSFKEILAFVMFLGISVYVYATVPKEGTDKQESVLSRFKHRSKSVSTNTTKLDDEYDDVDYSENVTEAVNDTDYDESLEPIE